MKKWVDFFRIRLYLKIPTLLTFFSACLIWYQTQYHNLTQSDKSIIKRYVIMIQTSFGTFKFGGKWERSAYTSNHWLEANDWRIGLSIYLEEEEKHIWICCYYYYCWCVQVWTVYLVADRKMTLELHAIHLTNCPSGYN